MSTSRQQGEHAESTVWNAVYRSLSRTFRPTAFKSHFGGLLEMDLARVLLRHWARSSSQQPRDWVNTGGYYVLRLGSTDQVSRQDLYQEFHRRTKAGAVDGVESHITPPLQVLLTLLSDRGIDRVPGLGLQASTAGP